MQMGDDFPPEIWFLKKCSRPAAAADRERRYSVGYFVWPGISSFRKKLYLCMARRKYGRCEGAAVACRHREEDRGRGFPTAAAEGEVSVEGGQLRAEGAGFPLVAAGYPCFRG